MTYPSGAPGGYPGQGPHQPAPGPAGYGPPPGGGLKLSLPQMLAMGVGGLGVLNLFLGFAPIVTGSGFYESFFGWIPALFFAGGLAALPAILPGDKEKQKAGVLPVVLSLSAALAFLFTVFASSASLAAGGVMVLIFGIIQAGAAVTAYLFEAGVIKPPAPNPYGAPGGYPQQPGGYPPSGAFPAQQPPGGPQATVQQPQPGQQPFGGPGQQTQFAPQQGQFGAPGTPPGGYPQQQPPQ